jgi:hypothetical protein
MWWMYCVLIYENRILKPVKSFLRREGEGERKKNDGGAKSN